MSVWRPHLLKRFDFFAAPLLALCIIALRRFLDRIWPKPQPQGTLVIRPGGMGDLILWTLACREAGQDFRTFYYLIESRSEPWARHLGLDYLCVDRAGLRKLAALRSRFKLALVTEQLFGMAILPALWAARESVGFSTLRQRHRLTRTVPYRSQTGHEVHEFQKLLRPDQDLVVPPPLIPRAQAPGEEWGIGIAGLQSVTRAFSLEIWEAWARAWLRQTGTPRPRVWIAGAPIDLSFMRRLAQKLEDAADVVIHDAGFGPLCERIARSQALLTIDGGLLHVASFYGVPTTAIFTSSIADKWAPLGPDSQVVKTSGLACQPCAHFAQVPPCPNRYRCKRLSGDAVAAGFPRPVHKAPG